MEQLSELDRIKDHLEKLLFMILEVDSLIEMTEDYISIENSEDFKLFNMLPIFFSNIYNSFVKSICIDLCIIFDKPEKSNRGIQKLLKRIENQLNLNFINSKNKEKLKIAIRENNLKINDNEKSFKSLLDLRDKIYAHKDRRYFDNPDLIIQEIKFSMEDIKKLIEIAKSIVGFWYSELIIEFDMSSVSKGEFDHLIQILKQYKIDRIEEHYKQ